MYSRSPDTSVFPSRHHPSTPGGRLMPVITCNTFDCLCLSLNFTYGNIKYVHFVSSFPYISLLDSTIFSSVVTSLLFTLLNCISLCKNATIYLCPTVRGHLGSFQYRAIINSVSINILGHCFQCTVECLSVEFPICWVSCILKVPSKRFPRC